MICRRVNGIEIYSRSWTGSLYLWSLRNGKETNGGGGGLEICSVERLETSGKSICNKYSSFIVGVLEGGDCWAMDIDFC